MAQGGQTGIFGFYLKEVDKYDPDFVKNWLYEVQGMRRTALITVGEPAIVDTIAELVVGLREDRNYLLCNDPLAFDIWKPALNAGFVYTRSASLLTPILAEHNLLLLNLLRRDGFKPEVMYHHVPTGVDRVLISDTSYVTALRSCNEFLISGGLSGVPMDANGKALVKISNIITLGNLSELRIGKPMEPENYMFIKSLSFNLQV